MTEILPPEVSVTPSLAMRDYLRRIATGPHLSKDLSLAEARDAMAMILNQSVSAVQAGVFLIALRMKRETDEENCGVLQALRDATHRVAVEVDELVDISDPYSGYNRGLPATAFMPAVLAACGVPAFCHGSGPVGPKFGITPRRVLVELGQRADLAPEIAAERIADPDIGWCYLDQHQFCPKLSALAELRNEIVKRPCLTTLESAIQPLRARRRTHLMTGYVHKAYPPVYTSLARFSGYSSALVIRGVEGGVIPSLARDSRLYRFFGETSDERVAVTRADFGIDHTVRAPPLPPDAGGEGAFNVAAATAATARAGIAALDGRRGPMRDALVYGAAIVLWHLRRADTSSQAAVWVRGVLDSGAARARFDAGLA